MMLILTLSLSSCFVVQNRFERYNNEVKKSYIKSNMHTLQLMVEVYAVDWGGVYPYTLEALFKEATEKNYFKALSNPATKQVWDHKNPSGKGVIAIYSPTNRTPGLLFYKSTPDPQGKIRDYTIRANDLQGHPIKHLNKPFILSNH